MVCHKENLRIDRIVTPSKQGADKKAYIYCDADKCPLYGQGLYLLARTLSRQEAIAAAINAMMDECNEKKVENTRNHY